MRLRQVLPFIFLLLLLAGGVYAQENPTPVPPPFPPFLNADIPLPADSFDLNAVVPCDFAAPTYLTHGTVVRSTSKYVNGAVTAGAVPSNNQFALMMNQYIASILPTARQLTTAADPMLDGTAVGISEYFWVDGEPICVPDPRHADAMAVYWFVHRLNEVDATGYIRESLHWDDVPFSTLTSGGGIDQIAQFPDFTLDSLSVYFLEPSNINPDLLGSMDLDITADPNIVCPNGAPSRVVMNESAVFDPSYALSTQYAASMDATSPQPEDFETALSSYASQIALYTEPAVELYDGYGLPPLILFNPIVGGPECTTFQTAVNSVGFEAIGCVFADDIDACFDELAGGYVTHVVTWWQVQVIYKGVELYGVWVPESYAVFADDNPQLAIYYYFMQPVQRPGEQSFLVDTSIGDFGANYSVEREVEFVDDLRGAACDAQSILPARVGEGDLANPIAETLNVRSTPNGDVIGTMNGSEAMMILDGAICKDGFRWWLVRSLANSTLTGWVAEADASVYYIEPGMPPEPTATPMPITAPETPTQPPPLPPPPADSDGDGVPDSIDVCPGTAPGVVVSTDGSTPGCPLPG